MPKINAKVFPQFYEPSEEFCGQCCRYWETTPEWVNLDWVEVAGDVCWFVMRYFRCPICGLEYGHGEMVDESPLP